MYHVLVCTYLVVMFTLNDGTNLSTSTERRQLPIPFVAYGGGTVILSAYSLA